MQLLVNNLINFPVKMFLIITMRLKLHYYLPLDIYHEPPRQNDLNPSSSQENRAQTPTLPPGEKKTKPTSYQETLRKNRLLLAMNKGDDTLSTSSTESAIDSICHIPPLTEGIVCIFILLI